MLPVLPRKNSKINKFQVIPPPQIDTKGNLTLVKLKSYCDSVYETNKQLVQELISNQNDIDNLNNTILNLTEDVKMKMNFVSDMRIRMTNESRTNRSQNESERLLYLETKQRLQQQEKAERLEGEIVQLKQEHANFKEKVVFEMKEIKRTDHLVEELRRDLKKTQDDLTERDFQVDQLRVEVIHFQRVNDTLTKNNQELLQQNESLTESSNILVQENAQLQKRIKELIAANKEVTTNYQIVKKNFDIKKQESDELALEVEDAKNACQLALKQKKSLQSELDSCRKLKNELDEKLKMEQELSFRKEKIVIDLQRKIEETVQDYEDQLHRKEEQLWSTNAQLSEETSKAEKQRQALSAAQKKKEAAAVVQKPAVEAEIITDIEKKWQRKEKQLLQELDDANNLLREKHRMTQSLCAKITELEQDKYHPRMEYLEQIEKTMKNRLIDLALAQEKLETGFICPRDLKPFKIPTTLTPCGHTFCKDCVDTMQQENFNVLKCDICRMEATSTFRNEQVERVIEQFEQRSEIFHQFSEW